MPEALHLTSGMSSNSLMSDSRELWWHISTVIEFVGRWSAVSWLCGPFNATQTSVSCFYCSIMGVEGLQPCNAGAAGDLVRAYELGICNLLLIQVYQTLTGKSVRL